MLKMNGPQSRRAGCHDCRDKRVGLRKRWVLDVQSIHCNTVQRGVVQNNRAVAVLHEPLQRQHRIVWLYHNVAALSLIWEDTVRLHELLLVAIIKRLHQP